MSPAEPVEPRFQGCSTWSPQETHYMKVVPGSSRTPTPADVSNDGGNRTAPTLFYPERPAWREWSVNNCRRNGKAKNEDFVREVRGAHGT